MRAILIDWLVDVHLKFKLLPETLYITVNLIDRYLEKERVARNKLQLIGVTCMLIAAKYEEIYPPELKNFVYITDNAYSRKEVLQMEYNILSKLGFDVTFPSCFRFLERFAKLFAVKDTTFSLAHYYLDVAALDYRMLTFAPSQVSATALYMACKVTESSAVVNESMCKMHLGYSEHELQNCVH